MVLDIKLDAELTWKARLIADVHNVDTPTSITYNSVVSRVSVWIMLMLADLNPLDVKCTEAKIKSQREA